ncbi:hypothetical protein LFM09_24715 [Lentzea alba]|uniref:SpaA isopeptide-forming pilin-related protein n=1 Tax=Lentzea alba TaxID=2714351 RepID=UPI0039BEED23
MTATATVAAGPFLIGQTVPIALTVTNIGDVTATGLQGLHEHKSGSYLGINPDDWGGLQDETVDPGASKTFTVRGKAYSYNGNSKIELLVTAEDDLNPYNGIAPVDIAFREPTPTGRLSGVLWGDANRNGTQDPSEGLAGAKTYVTGGGPSRTTTTDADGRFEINGIEVAAWSINFSHLPGGWVIRHSSEEFLVDGTTSGVARQAVRPLTDKLAAEARFVGGEYVDGGTAKIEVALANRTGTDLTGVKAGCNRSGSGPHLDIEDLGELDYRRGATIPAGQTRVFTLSGTVPVDASNSGHVYVWCDFGDDETLSEGFPRGFDYVKVGDKVASTNGSIYVDRNGNGWMDDGEALEGATFSLSDPKTGAIVATATSDSSGRAYFRDIPAGRYLVVAERFRVLSDWHVIANVCSPRCNDGWTVQVA